ncbi:MAG: phenylalanine--tRNA ligase subunit beta [Chloroflexi bacterium]|nr:phenylalanine--tRNA ligase subunit beta [Chloroflexota bacterium]
MKISVNWLRDYVDVALPVKEVAHKLTMSGTEVGATEVVGRSWEKVVVGHINAVAPHPNADHLTLVTVDLGLEHSTVVCGAPNVRVGDKVPFAKTGAQLMDAHTGKLVQLKRAKIRGIVSDGMACSEKELGISDNHQGLMILPADAPVGMPLAEYLGDAVLDLEVTPNRPDCLSVIGIARELAALTKKSLKVVEPRYEQSGPAIEQLVSVDIAAPDLCHRYCASLIENLKIAPSPAWLQQRLIACGTRPINNIVDVTNYVMLEYGQPLHAFDFDRIGGRKIIVRRASEGEKLVTIDGVERTLAPSMLVIADAGAPMAVAGIMGGTASEVTGATTAVLIESASFLQASIRRTAADLKMRTEASIRFERGTSPDLTMPAIRRATELIVELGHGTAAKGIADVYPGKKDAKRIVLPLSEVERVLGIEVKTAQIIEILTSLGFECQPTSPSEVEVVAPYWRMDVNGSVDLAEELARIVGYDFIPTTMLTGRVPGQHVDPTVRLRERLRDLMVGCGFQEIIGYSLVNKERMSQVAPAREAIRVTNASRPHLEPSLEPETRRWRHQAVRDGQGVLTAGEGSAGGKRNAGSYNQRFQNRHFLARPERIS